MQEQYTHGTNPVFLIDKIVRTKIYSCTYYKEKCFALDAKTIIDCALDLRSIGGTFGGSKKPTPFLCLVLKLLQISPDREIVQKYIESDYKYLRALGCMHLRLTAKAEDVYNTLEPLYNDYRKIKIRQPAGDLAVIHIDEFVDELLRQDIYLETVLPKITRRHVLEETEGMPLRVSVLDGELKFEESGVGKMEVERESDGETNRSKIGRGRKKAKLGEGGQNPQKEPAPESVEYWNLIRKQLGLAPLKENL